MCRIKKTKLDILNEDSSPLLKGKTFPTEPLFNDGLQHLHQLNYDEGKSRNEEIDDFSAQMSSQPLYRSCAVVPNSAARTFIKIDIV